VQNAPVSVVPDANAPLYPADQWILKETGKSSRGDLASDRVLPSPPRKSSQLSVRESGWDLDRGNGNACEEIGAYR
jgi:hypothetical protein